MMLAPSDTGSQDTEAARRLSDILDMVLAELAADGFEIRQIFASPENIARLFLELGDDAIDLDPDGAEDCAWYGEHALLADEGEGVRILYCKDDECWFREVEGA